MRILSLTFNLLLVASLTYGQERTVLPLGQEAIYTATFDIGNSTMNGFLAASHQHNHVLHVSFSTPTGNTLLEMRWENGCWKKVYAIKPLGRHRVFNMIGEDIMLLFAHYQYDKEFHDLGESWAWKKWSLIPTWSGQKLQAVKVLDRRGKLMNTILFNTSADGTGKMTLEHQDYPFSIALEPIRKN